MAKTPRHRLGTHKALRGAPHEGRESGEHTHPPPLPPGMQPFKKKSLTAMQQNMVVENLKNVFFFKIVAVHKQTNQNGGKARK